MVKKIVAMLCIVCTVVMQTSCSFRGGRMLVRSDGQIADARLEQILSALKDKNKEALKGLFSKQALDETKDFDDGIEYVFDFFQGNVESWERDTLSSGEKIRHGKKSVMITSFYLVNTDVNQYMFFVIDYAKDTIKPNNEGMYTLRVIKAEDEETEFGYWQDMTIPGIYKPKE